MWSWERRQLRTIRDEHFKVSCWLPRATMSTKHLREKSLVFWVNAAAFMEPRRLFCLVQGKEVRQFRRREILKEKGMRAGITRQRGPATAVVITSPTGWKGEDSDQSLSGVTIWPGHCVCCCPSAACCSLLCWEQGRRYVINGWLIRDNVNYKAGLISLLKEN